MARLIIDLEDDLAELLTEHVSNINENLEADWTVETLAASYLTHVLLDDQDCHGTLH